MANMCMLTIPPKCSARFLRSIPTRRAAPGSRAWSRGPRGAHRPRRARRRGAHLEVQSSVRRSCAKRGAPWTVPARAARTCGKPVAMWVAVPVESIAQVVRTRPARSPPPSRPPPASSRGWRTSAAGRRGTRPRRRPRAPAPRAATSTMRPSSHVRYSRVPGVCGMPVIFARGGSSMRSSSMPGIGSGRSLRTRTPCRASALGSDPSGSAAPSARGPR